MRQGEQMRQALITLSFMPRDNFQTSMEGWGAQAKAGSLQREKLVF